MLAIEARSLRREFPGVVAVDSLDMEIREGEVFGFLGPNGAGKTTTVRMLTTLLRPTSGTATIGGFDLATQQHRIRQTIGVALQEAGLDGLATGRELLTLQARLYGLRGPDPARRAIELLELVGLTHAADRRIKTYSGGMKRRLDLASALIHGPRILFLDEPTGGLDPASRHAIWEEVRHLNRAQGVTVFLTTQYLEEADVLVDRLAIIDHGRIVAEGTPATLKASIGSDVVVVDVSAEHLEEARQAVWDCEGVTDIRADGTGLTLFVRDGSAVAPQVIRRLDNAHIRVGSVAVSHPSLDEVFLRATGSRLEGAEPQTEPEEEKVEVS